MRKITENVEFVAGYSGFRIIESKSPESFEYEIYDQVDIEADFWKSKIKNPKRKSISVLHKLNTLNEHDIVYSLTTGMAAIVQRNHVGFTFPQSYVVLKVNSKLSPEYLVYLLNESQVIKKQLWIGLQGSIVLRYSIQQLRDLRLPELPGIHRQQLIGGIYVKQMELQALKRQRGQQELALNLSLLKVANAHG